MLETRPFFGQESRLFARLCYIRRPLSPPLADLVKCLIGPKVNRNVGHRGNELPNLKIASCSPQLDQPCLTFLMYFLKLVLHKSAACVETEIMD